MSVAAGPPAPLPPSHLPACGVHGGHATTWPPRPPPPAVLGIRSLATAARSTPAPPLPPCRREGYRDAYLTAHFEVPGEMFSLAMDAKRQRGMGVVGSTQNILDFIAAK